MAKSRKRTRRSRKFTVPMAVMVPTAYVGYNAALYAINQSPQVALEKVTKWFTGYSLETGRWSFDNFRLGLFPIAGGLIVHKIASRLGVNRALGSAGIPWIRI